MLMSLPTTAKPEEKDITMRNVVTLGIGMSLCLIGIKVSSSFIVPILGNVGSISMALLYFSNSFANFFVPPLLNLFGNERRAMFWTVFEYCLYILQFAYIIIPLNLVWSFIHGIFAALIWTAEGIYLCANSNDSDRGKKSGIFWTLYMTGAAGGNIAVYFLLKKMNINDFPSSSGWHGAASIMFIVLALTSLLGAIPMAMLKPSAAETRRKFVAKTSQKVLVNKMIRMVVSPNMRWLIIPMFFVGFEYVFIGSMLTRQVHQTGEVGLMMSLFCIVEMIMSTPFGLLLDRIGNVASFLLSTLLELAAIITFWYANKSQGGLFYLAFIFLSLSDSSYETVIPTIIGRNYSDQESANSTYRLFQYMGGCICYLIAPLFVDGDTKYVSDASLMRELLLCGVLCVLSAICFVVYERVFKKELPVVTKEPAHPDAKTKELVHVINEDLDEISKVGAKAVTTAKLDDVKVTSVNNEDFTH